MMEPIRRHIWLDVLPTELPPRGAVQVYVRLLLLVTLVGLAAFVPMLGITASSYPELVPYFWVTLVSLAPVGWLFVYVHRLRFPEVEDYIERKHVKRFRADFEKFLEQARNQRARYGARSAEERERDPELGKSIDASIEMILDFLHMLDAETRAERIKRTAEIQRKWGGQYPELLDAPIEQKARWNYTLRHFREHLPA